MKKFAFSVVAFIFILALISCGGGGKYSDAKAVMNDYCDSMSNFADELNKAGNAVDVAKAINNFSDEMEKYIPKLKELDKKYPEMKTQKEEEIPAELKPVMERLQKEIMPKFISAMGKIQQYMNDPLVQEANKKMSETMSR